MSILIGWWSLGPRGQGLNCLRSETDVDMPDPIRPTRIQERDRNSFTGLGTAVVELPAADVLSRREATGAPGSEVPHARKSHSNATSGELWNTNAKFARN